MLMRTAASLLLLIFGSVATGLSQAEPAAKSCREHPMLVGRCFRVHGRLAVYNGAPAIRLWRIGTRRMLGISEQRFNVPEYRNLPESLAHELNGENEILGDFLVCPFTRSQPGRMHLICIDTAENITVRKRQ